jgi:hypothetical protein
MAVYDSEESRATYKEFTDKIDPNERDRRKQSNFVVCRLFFVQTEKGYERYQCEFKFIQYCFLFLVNRICIRVSKHVLKLKRFVMPTTPRNVCFVL